MESDNGDAAAFYGSAGPNGIAEASQPAVFGQRTVLAGFEVKHWIGSKGGILAGVSVERLNDRMTGTGLYARRGITLGICKVVERAAIAAIRGGREHIDLGSFDDPEIWRGVAVPGRDTRTNARATAKASATDDSLMPVLP